MSHKGVITKYMASEMKGLKRAGRRDHSPGIWSHIAYDQDQQYFPWNQGSSIKFFWVQGSKFSSFLESGMKILGKNTGSVTKKYISLRPCHKPKAYYFSNEILQNKGAGILLKQSNTRKRTLITVKPSVSRNTETLITTNIVDTCGPIFTWIVC